MGRHPFGTEALCPFKGINGRLSIHLYVSNVVVTKDYLNMSLLHVQLSYDPTLKTRVQLECVSWYITNVPIVIQTYIVQSTDDRYQSFQCLPPNIYDVKQLVEAGFSCTECINHSVPTIKCTACALLFNPTSLQGATPYQFHLDRSPDCEFFQENGLQNEHHTNTRDDDSFASDQRTSRSLQPRRTNVQEGLEEKDNVNKNYTTNGIKTKSKRENDKKVVIPNGALSLETTGEEASYYIENAIPTEIHGARPRDGTESNATHFPQQRFVTKESRIASFQHRMWPKEKVHQSPKELAEAGFYYTGAKDIVRCFNCDIGFAEWTQEDDPWVEHARHSPECPYLRDQKGQDFINNIKIPWARIYTPKHPEYSQINVRRRSYENSRWPRDNVLQTLEQLAAAGFFYTGDGDTVRCHYCDGGLREWEPADDPWVEHARWFPFCKFVLKIKGVDFIKAAATRNPANGLQTPVAPPVAPQINQRLSAWTRDDDPWVEHARHSPECIYHRDQRGQDFNNQVQTQSVNKAVFPQYTQMEARIRTFESPHWPRDRTVPTPERLSVAGFFYTGGVDSVRCFSCGGGLRNWEPDDDPWVEHARWFPHCKLVLMMKGQTCTEVSDAANTASEEPIPEPPAVLLSSVDNIPPDGRTRVLTEDEEEKNLRDHSQLEGLYPHQDC